MRKRTDDIDNTIENLEEWEAKQSGEKSGGTGRGKVLIGTVEQFYHRISVAAIKLTASLKTDDIIEIGDENEAVRQKVVSMQINKEEVFEAGEGDSVGVKLNHPVSVGSNVYKIRSL